MESNSEFKQRKILTDSSIMIVSRVPAVVYCLQPTELQTDPRK